MIQLILPRLDIETNAGWCLWLAQAVFFGDDPKYHPHRSAWEQWMATTSKHTDKSLPDVSVPVWFEHWGTYGYPPKYANWGHVVVWIPKKGFLSSPGVGFGSEWLPTIAAVESRFRCKFVGWSEDISGVRIANVKGGDMPEEVQLGTAKVLAYACAARDGYDGRPNAHKAESDEDLVKNHVGQPLTNEYIMRNWYSSVEAANAFKIREAVYKERDDLRKLVNNAKPGEAEKTLTELAAILNRIQERK